jgi:signal transduction histidine kinase
MKSNTMTGNPVYADILMLNGDKIIISAEDVEGYSFLTEADGRGLRICTDGSGGYYMAYEVADKGVVRYEALLSLEQLYINALGGTPARGVMLIDSTSTVMLVQSGTQVIVASPMESLDDNLSQLRDYMTECQGAQVSGGSSLELSRPDGSTYTARIVVQPSSKTTNGEFAIGITADFDETLQPSRRAAERILLYGGVAVAGIIALVFLLLFTRRVNTANERDLEVLKKKNSAMEELNQNMQALAHHQRLETIGTMTASIAHDFNNLLTPIMGYSIMAAEMLPDDQTEIQDYMMEVYNASVKAKDIVQRLADLSKKGKEESYKTLDPVEIIRSSLKVTLPAKPKNVEVRGRFSSGMARIRGDATQISQLVINIVLNAYDAMREKGGVLTVSTRIEEGGVAMRFTDTGTGMDAETLARIFDPFYTTKESGKGTGLGLAIVHQICDTHGAKVYVDSEPGAGTEFRIIFPIVEAENMDKATTRVINGAEIRERLDKPDEI